MMAGILNWFDRRAEVAKAKEAAAKRPQPEQQGVTFDARHGHFERARTLLQFAGVVGASRLGIDGAIAEGLSIYANLDKLAAATAPTQPSGPAPETDTLGDVADDLRGIVSASGGLSPAPDWDALRGAAPDATGDLSSEDFVRKTRDDWR